MSKVVRWYELSMFCLQRLIYVKEYYVKSVRTGGSMLKVSHS